MLDDIHTSSERRDRAIAHNRHVADDERMAGFRTWCLDRPEIDDNIIRPTIGRKRGTYEISWAGSSDADLQRVRDEAARRGISLIVRRARYTPAQLRTAVEAIFESESMLTELGFELHGVCADPDTEGLIIEGVNSRFPDRADDHELDVGMVGSVRNRVASLPGIRGVILVEDIRVEPGRVHLL